MTMGPGRIVLNAMGRVLVIGQPTEEYGRKDKHGGTRHFDHGHLPLFVSSVIGVKALSRICVREPHILPLFGRQKDGRGYVL